MKQLLMSGVALATLGGAAWANCPAATVADMQGVSAGAYPQQFDLSEFQSAANCTLSIAENPAIGDLNGMIRGNGDLPAVADRLPSEPLVIVPYGSIGQYGGVLDALSNATESGTSDFLSVRHVNLFRYSDDLQTLVPNVAKSWEWNDDFTELTVNLREGHKWSDGAPFTSADVVFWYDNLMMDTNVIAEAKDYALAGGEPIKVEAVDDTTVRFTLAAPKPGLTETFSFTYVQPYQPKHFFEKFHPALDENADANAQALGYENGYELIKAYYGNSDWMDTPSPMLTAGDKLAGLPTDTMPTLESHILVKESTEGRHYVANPYFFQVDTQGNQLPYISEMDETYVPDEEVRTLKLLNGEVDYKSQGVNLTSAPVLLEGQENGNYTLEVKPSIGYPVLTFNVTAEDEAKRAIFNDIRFRTAMSVAMDRDQLNEVVAFGLGTPTQYIGFSPRPDFIEEKWANHEIAFDADRANALLDEIGLVDKDGDGFRDLPSGDPFVLDWQFSTQPASAQLIELIAQNWKDVGVNTAIKEVTSDEFRAAQTANSLDMGLWLKSQPAGSILGDGEIWVPPFDGYFDVRTGMLWAEYISSNGENGVEPPAWVADLKAALDTYQSSAPGSDASVSAAQKMVEIMTGELLFLGTVNAPAPIYHSNNLQNFTEFKTQSYEFYRTYPYRPAQWWLSE
ncbi:peptide/nickel transport system substrate-binding protein [Ruegeria halocynthiae]|uniref:Peptide/nickel transport system substrate-binding protein n=1 Tax=Ruegeria halocynthiae TaxID=985054 RepID=A0A1H3BI97_9RHOB|nr:ABC transporter substrate-binding protein [Ruegeria halocynthiae]SDX40779.1 peptide/nickel transport system substrate-binding protein [Ruegeria halocynthiae]